MPRDERTSVDTMERPTDVQHVYVAAPQPTQRFGLSFSSIVAGATAAAAAAVAASWLGVAGTVIGAVFGSIAVTIISALVKHPLEKSTAVIRETLPLAPQQRVQLPTETMVIAPDHRRVTPTASVVAVPSTRRASWKTVIVTTLLTVAVGLAALTGLELALGRPVSSLIGPSGDNGTTISHILGRDAGTSNSPANKPGHTSHTGQSGSGGSTSPVPTIPNSTTPNTDNPSSDSPSTEAPPSSDAPSTSEPTTGAQTTDPAAQGAPSSAAGE